MIMMIIVSILMIMILCDDFDDHNNYHDLDFDNANILIWLIMMIFDDYDFM